MSISRDIPLKSRNIKNIDNDRDYIGKIMNNLNYSPLFSYIENNKPIYNTNIVRLDTIGDGSCFFHALIMSFFGPYINNRINRRHFIRDLRSNLSNELSNKINGENITYYEKISDGQLPKLSKSIPEVSLDNMMKELDSSYPISNIYNEFISDAINRDIYLINYETKDVYMTGTKLSLLYKNRPSSVILYKPGHYETIGYIESNNTLRLSFDHDHQFIKILKNRAKELLNE